jgi:hypothetical protein
MFIADMNGWREVGKPKPRLGNDSVYQALRRGNRWCWIGKRFIEHSESPVAIDFKTNGPAAYRVLTTKSDPCNE